MELLPRSHGLLGKWFVDTTTKEPYDRLLVGTAPPDNRYATVMLDISKFGLRTLLPEARIARSKTLDHTSHGAD